MYPPTNGPTPSTHRTRQHVFQKTDQNSNDNVSHNTYHSYNNPQEERALPTGEASQGRVFLIEKRTAYRHKHKHIQNTDTNNDTHHIINISDMTILTHMIY
jgi:hypothetical protein